MKCIIYSIIALVAVTGQANISSALAAGSPLHHPERIILKITRTLLVHLPQSNMNELMPAGLKS